MILSLMLVLAVVETAGVASVMPFLAVLGDPTVVSSNPTLAWLYRVGRFRSTQSFLVALALGATVLVLFSAAFRILTTYALNRFTQMRQYSIGARLLETYLRQPYTFFLDRNTADLSKSVLSEPGLIVTKIIRPVLDLVSYGLVVVVLVAFLVAAEPMLALAASVVVGGTYLIVYLLVRQRLRRTGRDRIAANRERFTVVSEALGGIKDLKVLGRERAYASRFRDPAFRFARHQASAATLSTAPKYLIEGVGMGGVLAAAAALMTIHGDLGAVLPLLGLYAFAGYRLLPAAQHVYAAVSSIRFGLPAVDIIYDDLRRATEPATRSGDALSPVHSIRFADVSYTYPGAHGEAVTGLSFSIPAGSSAAFVGKTGAGKTTVIDLLLGLLTPTSGNIIIDSLTLGRTNVGDWQAAVGYVPQSIYLADASVRENIAFGISSSNIDDAAVERAARCAHIHTFVTELPLGYDTPIGERGVRLSGGQRQRIGIARALYHDPAVLVLDEATSALDSATEQMVMAGMRDLRRGKTIIIVAHRLSTVSDCDQVFLLERGRIASSGRLEDLEPRGHEGLSRIRSGI